jgi:hypothetical protein
MRDGFGSLGLKVLRFSLKARQIAVSLGQSRQENSFVLPLLQAGLEVFLRAIHLRLTKNMIS